jgi:hypothetical protein
MTKKQSQSGIQVRKSQLDEFPASIRSSNEGIH